MAVIPDSLQPLGEQDGARRGDDFGERVKHRPISHEENINRQLDRIAFLRSAGYPWAEAVYQLRDMVVGLEDQEFWDGIPKQVRERVKGSEVKMEEAREQYARFGWEGYPVRAYETEDGRIVYRPTAENLSNALRIITRLLARQGVLWKKKRVTRFSPWGEVTEEDDENES